MIVRYTILCSVVAARLLFFFFFLIDFASMFFDE